MTLPASPREGAIPLWPLTGQSDREVEVWGAWWRKPIAAVWEHNQEFEHVALVVRMFCEAEVEKSSAENRKTLRMMMADLRLTSDSMARARIRIVGDDLAEKREDSLPRPRSSARDRLTVVDGGGS